MNKRNLLSIVMILILLPGFVSAQAGRWEKDLSGSNWSLWLDRAAVWANDSIFLPPVKLSGLPLNPPTIGWEKLHNNNFLKTVNVPGTVEEHYWGAIGGIVPNVAGDYKGVSWWSKKFTLEEGLRGKRITIYFQSVNLRAEVFLNGKLVGYDVIGNTQFEVNATDAALFGQENILDVRITDPVGNFSWDDNVLMRWGNNLVPAVHGFGGITGSVILRATDKVSVSDIYVQNQPDPKKVNVIATLDNYTGVSQNGKLEVIIHEKGKPNAVVWSKTVSAAIPGTSKVITVPATVPNAKLWELSEGKAVKEAHLYEAVVKFTSNNNKIVDNHKQRFGFRWFDVAEKDGDKRFYLNGKRVFLLAAMTRGIWPKNGMFPTPEMATRDMKTMFDLGFNMMLMHRAIGQPGVFDYADSSGLLTYEEPGGYRVTANNADQIKGSDAQSIQWRSEKVKRMVLRDRSFPSMVIYNLKNEERLPPNDEDKKDMLMMYGLDPSRIITYNSGSDIGKSGPEYYSDKTDDPFELHILPFKPKLTTGWWDQHHWYAYSGYTDEMYRNPKFYLRGVINASRIPLAIDSLYPLNKKKVIFFGEEGAFGTMVRLQKIKDDIARDPAGATGYRELEHIDWFNHYNTFLDETGFRKAYPDVDSLTRSLGRNLHYFHARNIENVRMGNIADAYNINGWAADGITRTDVVDAYRYPTADASIIRYYTKPLYVAVKLRNKVVPVNTAPIADLYLINEKDIKGKHTLNVDLIDDKGKVIFNKSFEVDIKGGEDFGQKLVENIQLPAVSQQGYYKLKTTMVQGSVKIADGFDEIYAVDVNDNTSIPGNVTVLETDNAVKDFFSKTTKTNVNAYSISGPEANVIIIGNYNYDLISAPVMDDIFRRVHKGAKLIVLSNADKFAQKIDEELKTRPVLYNGGGIMNLAGSGRFFVGFNPILTGLPQGQGMSWEYQVFYKGVQMGQSAQVSGIRINNFRAELVVALGNQGSKEILSALSRVSVGKGNVTLSTLNILPNLDSKELHAVVAKKLFLNLLSY